MTRSLDFSWGLYPRHFCGEWNTVERRGEEVSTSLSMPDTSAKESSLQHDERREEEVTGGASRRDGCWDICAIVLF